MLYRAREYAFKKLCNKFYGINIFNFDIRTKVMAIDNFTNFFQYFDLLITKYYLIKRYNLLVMALNSYSKGHLTKYDKFKLGFNTKFKSVLIKMKILRF